MQTHSRQAKIAYALAAVPAALPPLSYVVMCVWVMSVIVPALLSGKDAGDPGGSVLLILQSGLVATAVQWPVYVLWAACARGLTPRLRFLWILVLLILNMLAIPWFLFCMYRGTARTALVRRIRNESIRRFFEKGAGIATDGK